MSKLGEKQFQRRNYNLRRGKCLAECSKDDFMSKRTRVYSNLRRREAVCGQFSLNNEEKIDVDSSDVESQDADYSYFPLVCDELALMILARVPRSEHRKKLCFVNKNYLALMRSEEVYKVRREIGIKEKSVFMLASGESCWWEFHPQSSSCRKLPILESDPCFESFDKESICAGTHLLVSGKEIEGSVIWRYELAVNQWFKGPLMLTSRCLFASANCGDFACIAGGIGSDRRVLNSAERYNPESKSWDPLPRMHQQRHSCSGIYMDNRFYVIGGRDAGSKDLSCGEYYDMERNLWVLIPDMLKDAPKSSFGSPPLVAVARNELYSIEPSTNELRMYLKGSNTWKGLGKVPIRADYSLGWGVAFKSLGDRLLVIGGVRNFISAHPMTICTWKPDSDARWQFLETDGHHMGSFVFNCSVMGA